MVLMADDPEVLAERLRATFRLHDEGVRLMRQNLRRRHPESSTTRSSGAFASGCRSVPEPSSETP